jgi:peptidoglycan/LPS O-acetylase OafA/YrhL
MRVLWDKLAPHVPGLTIPPALAYVVLSIVVASVSWHLFERPIQRLKGLVRYAAPPDGVKTQGLSYQAEAA